MTSSARCPRRVLSQALCGTAMIGRTLNDCCLRKVERSWTSSLQAMGPLLASIINGERIKTKLLTKEEIYTIVGPPETCRSSTLMPCRRISSNCPRRSAQHQESNRIGLKGMLRAEGATTMGAHRYTDCQSARRLVFAAVRYHTPELDRASPDIDTRHFLRLEPWGHYSCVWLRHVAKGANRALHQILPKVRFPKSRCKARSNHSSVLSPFPSSTKILKRSMWFNTSSSLAFFGERRTCGIKMAASSWIYPRKPSIICSFSGLIG